MPLRVLWHWQTMGPYHFARMHALASMRDIHLTVVESTSSDDHGWTRAGVQNNLDLITLSSKPFSPLLLSDTQPALENVLLTRRPDVVIAAGYSKAGLLNPVIRYTKSNPAALMVLWSESTRLDRKRTWLKESLKKLLMPAFDGAVVAGPIHASYLAGLGMPPEDIQVTGNCVDNSFFSNGVEGARHSAGHPENLPDDYFLFVGRMIPEKNLPVLIDAYRIYRERAGGRAWNLVLIGSGIEEPGLKLKVANLGIQGVSFAGLQQAEELRGYYARAKSFVLPSISEPWGLVVNEAMASGLPVLVSNRCGCAHDLVRPGVNGFLFDPFDTDALADAMQKISAPDVPLEQMRLQSRRIIADYSPQAFAQRTAGHFHALRDRKATRPRMPQRLSRFIAHKFSAVSGLLS